MGWIISGRESQYGIDVSQYPSMKAPDLLRLLKRSPLDYQVARSRGSHRVLQSASGYPELRFAFHDQVTIPPGLVRKILTKDIGMTDVEALRLL